MENTRNWLREKRKLMGYKSCEEFAEKIGISPSHYTSIENGSRNPSRLVARKIAFVAGFEWTELYKDEFEKGDST